MLRKVHDERLLLFEANLFAFNEGVTERQSRDIVEAPENAHVLIPVPGRRYRLSETFDTTNSRIRIPEGMPGDAMSATADELLTMLAPYYTPPVDPQVPRGRPSIPVFDDTLFAKLPGVSEVQSRAIIAANSDLIVRVPVPDVYWLAEGFDPEDSDIGIRIPEGVPVSQKDARDLLARYHASEILPSLLSTELALPAPTVKAIIALTGTDLSAAQFTHALQATEPTARLVELVVRLLRLRILFKDLHLDTDVVRCLVGTLPETEPPEPSLFDVTDFATLSLATVRLVALYGEILGSGDDSAERRRALLERLRYRADDGSRFFSGSEDRLGQRDLATVLGIADGLAITAQEVLLSIGGQADSNPEALEPEESNPEVHPLEALVRLTRGVELANRLGVGGEILPRIVSNDHPALDLAADALRSAIRTKYPDDAQWQERM